MKTILVCDDSEVIQNIIEKALSDEYNVLKAYDGYEAMKIVMNNNDIGGVLLDLTMPKYDGFAVLDFFKNNNLFKKIPVSIISGDDTKETINKAFTYDIIDMLNKPFSKENIKEFVNKMVNTKA